MSIVEAEHPAGVPVSVSVEIGGKEITFETGKLAKQADGAVVVRSGDTVVLGTAQGRTEAREGADFFPLTVDVEERMYAAGKIPGGFFKREGRPTERAILTARMTDRPVRPLWPKGYRNEVQCVATVFSADLITAHDILCINAVSAALTVSPLPVPRPDRRRADGDHRGRARDQPDARAGRECRPRPDRRRHEGRPDHGRGRREPGAGGQAPRGARDRAPRDREALRGAGRAARRSTASRSGSIPATTERLEASYGHEIWTRINEVGLREAASIVEEIVTKEVGPVSETVTQDNVSKELQVRMSLAQILEKQRSVAVETVVREQFENDLKGLTDAEQDSKELKSAKRSLLFDRIVETVKLPFPVGPATVDGEPAVKDSLTKSYVKKACEAIYKSIVRQKIAVDKRRPDGRSATEIRPIEVEVSVMPRTHGSGLFTRGQTQIMSLLTLGTAKEGQRIDDLSLERDRRFMHHYNFPPYSVGETGRMGSPKRRDIGHGALAQRALEAVLPPTEDFPYTIRIVSETLESNGSSSMGSVCGSTLALMDAGVPIKAPVSGIAMGLVKEGDAYEILTDIQGAEDHLGDMDFKVAGTAEGITALQMDIKITGVSREIMEKALSQAKDARIAILGRMETAISAPREALAEHAPRISTIQINPEFIGMVIGKGGETIRSLESEYEVQIDIEEDGTILVYATEGTKGDAAIEAIRNLTKEPEVGDEYTGRVVKTTDFGAFVELKKGTDGLLHVSNVGPGRVNHIEDVIARGDILDVLVQEVDKARGRIGLKLVQKHENGGMVSPEELVERAKDAPPREPREDRGPRRDGRGGPRGPRRDREGSRSD